MKYIVDIINTITDEEFNSWVSAGNHMVIHSFDHFEKTYLIETDGEISVGGIVESVKVDDHTTALKLLATPTFTLDTNNDDDWWKSLVITKSLNYDSPEVIRRGTGYAVYLMDSGVSEAHSDFANTSIRHLFSHTGTNADLNGHGTALASIISGTTAGITSAEIVSVKIFEGGTPTLISDLLRALDAVALDYIQNYPTKPAIVNMSWGIDKNEYIESKIRAMIDLGLIFVAAAGNSGIPISDVTPAGMSEVLTIGSINTNLEPSDFSNYTGSSSISLTSGETNYSPGLDYWAPGEYILAANKNGGYNHIAGTSAAAAIFSATAAYSFARMKVEFGKEYITTGVIPVLLSGEGTSIVTRESFRDEIRIAGGNQFIFSKVLVQLPDKYQNCTNRVSVVYGLRVPTLETEFDHKAQNIDPLYATTIIVQKDVPLHSMLVENDQVDSFSVSSLPNGLTLEGNMVVGMMSESLGDDKFKVFTSKLTLVRGIDQLEVDINFLYLDPSIVSDTFTGEDYDQLIIDSNLILFAGTCTSCNGSTFSCAGTTSSCASCIECTAGNKIAFGELCRADGNCP